MKINDSLIKFEYSTEERPTHKIWIDGRPIYRKVIFKENQSFPVKGTSEIPHNITNFGELIDLKYSLYYQSNGSWYKQFDGVTTKNLTVNSTNIVFNSIGSSTFKKAYFIIEYTKTQ